MKSRSKHLVNLAKYQPVCKMYNAMDNNQENKEPKALQTKEHIMQVGLMLISKNTYSNIGVQEICNQAGVTKGGFYHHFKSKADLFKQSSDYLWNKKKADLDKIVSPELKPRDQVEALISFLMSAYENASKEECQAGFCPIFCSGAQGGSEDKIVHETINLMSERIQNYTIQLTKNLISNNDIPDSTDPNQTGRLLHYFLQGIIMHSKTNTPEDHAESDLRNGIFRILKLSPN